MSKYPIDSKEDIAKRLLQLRELSGMNRRALARKYGFSEHTLKSWEKGLQTGLPRKSAELVINAYQSEHIECSVNWLMTGKGKGPKRKDIPDSSSLKVKEKPENAFQTIAQEIEFFKKVHPEAAVHTVKDDSMLPEHQVNDIVAGVWHYGQDISKLIGKVCIIECRDGTSLLRVLRASTIPFHYNLFALNPQTRVMKPYQYDADIVAAAPIVWIRRGKNN